MAAQKTAGARRFQTFRYTRPEMTGEAQTEVALCGSDILDGSVRIVPAGGGVSLHAHTGRDEFWMVAAGRARFYGAGRTLMGEFDPGDGLLIPRNTDFAYDSVGDEDLELLRVSARESGVADERLDREPRRPADHDVRRLSGRVL